MFLTIRDYEESKQIYDIHLILAALVPPSESGKVNIHDVSLILF